MSGEGASGSKPRKPAEGPTTPRAGFAVHGPAWITAIATILTATAGAWVLLAQPATDPSLSVTAAATVAERAPRVSMTSAGPEGGNMVGRGDYADLDIERWAVALLVRRADQEVGPWAWVIAATEPTSKEGALEDGTWSGSVPMVAEFEMFPAIVPSVRGGGFGGDVESDLREHGPDATSIIAHGDVVTVSATASDDPGPDGSP
jgi:hypothetical protein